MESFRIIFVTLAFCAAVCLARPEFGENYLAYPKYAYNYGVADKKTGDIKHAEEYRDGKVTKGSYALLQPDGLVRTVKYVVDPKGGFQAKVSYSGNKDVGLAGIGVLGLANQVSLGESLNDPQNFRTSQLVFENPIGFSNFGNF